ncbi:MAG: hypothetical protein QGD94_12215, partial [Planctomycetia bacterium]|nr:hypothetical protein [Planctomycetia bacterium]
MCPNFWQHSGAKDGSTLYVQYNFDDTVSSGVYTKAMRMKSVRYPDSTLVHYTYGASDTIADKFSRIDAIKDDSGGSPNNTLASYKYNGAGRLVVEDFEQPDVRLDYWGQSADTYAGFDRFGRIITQKWYDYGASAERDIYNYAHDPNFNRLYRENTQR